MIRKDIDFIAVYLIFAMALVAGHFSELWFFPVLVFAFGLGYYLPEVLS